MHPVTRNLHLFAGLSIMRSIQNGRQFADDTLKTEYFDLNSNKAFFPKSPVDRESYLI